MTFLSPLPDSGPVTRAAPLESFRNGASIGVGSLPHLNAEAAAAFSVSEFRIATVPSLPRRSPAENLIAQAIGGLPGVSFGQYGSFAIDPVGLTEDTPVVTDLSHDAFAGLRAFLDLATKLGLDGKPVKWQFVGPVTLGVALERAGLRNAHAFILAADAVRQHVAAISDALRSRLPNSPQLLLLDEPHLTRLMEPNFPVVPDAAVDLVSTAMAAVANDIAVGLHCCGSGDVATMLECGPQVISIPMSADLIEYAGYIGRHLDSGGVVVWGVIPTNGPTPTRADRFRNALTDLWAQLIERGVDEHALYQQSLITAACGLSEHGVSTATRVARLARDVSEYVHEQAVSSPATLGA